MWGQLTSLGQSVPESRRRRQLLKNGFHSALLPTNNECEGGAWKSTFGSMSHCGAIVTVTGRKQRRIWGLNTFLWFFTAFLPVFCIHRKTYLVVLDSNISSKSFSMLILRTTQRPQIEKQEQITKGRRLASLCKIKFLCIDKL